MYVIKSVDYERKRVNGNPLLFSLSLYTLLACNVARTGFFRHILYFLYSCYLRKMSKIRKNMNFNFISLLSDRDIVFCMLNMLVKLLLKCLKARKHKVLDNTLPNC